MASLTLKASIPAILIVPGMKLVLEAVSPTTGSAVGGVTSSRWSIYGDTEAAAEDLGPPGPYMLVPGPESVAGGDTSV